MPPTAVYLMANNATGPRPLAVDRDVWERQPRESEQAWTAFQDYRDGPHPRRLRETAQRTGRNKGLVERWSSWWSWRLRVTAYDRWVEERTHAKLVEDIVAFRRRAAQQARAKAQTLMLPSIVLAEMISSPDGMKVLRSIDPETLLQVAVRAATALPHVLRAEALALGDVTERPAEPEADSLTEALRGDADARSILASALQRLGSGASTPSGVGDAGVEGPVGECPAPNLPVPAPE